MFAWATEQFDKLSQTVAPPPDTPAGRYQYAVQRLEEDTAMGCMAEIDAVYTVVVASKGSYAIHLACEYSLLRLIRLIMNQPGASMQQVDSNGNTPLHYACMSTQPNALDVVKVLLMDYGADVCAKNAQGKQPYDMATLNSVRQHLLPLQLQKETQACLDNGGQGLPPGIDLGGLKIQNSAMPPPPTFAGGVPGGPPMGAAAATGSSSSFSMSAAGTAKYAPPPMPNAPTTTSVPTPTPTPAANPVISSPHAVPPSPQTFPSTPSVSAPVESTTSAIPPAPRSYGGRSASSGNRSTDLATDPNSGYSRTGGSSLAVYSKYKADGFHSSSSDVNLQKKYGHAVPGSGPGAVPPPPTSGNSVTSGGVPVGAATPTSFQASGGPNPFSRSSSGLSSASGSGGVSRYPTYGPTAAASTASPGFSPSQMYNQVMSPSSDNAPAPQYFTPTVPKTAAEAAAPVQTAGTSSNPAAAAALFETPQPTTSAPSGFTASTSVNETDSSGANENPNGNSSSSSDWIETTDPTSGNTYYYNPITNETRWDKPPMTSSSSSLDGPGDQQQQEGGDNKDDDDNVWQEIQDPTSGKPYYYNATTNETRWEKPESLTTKKKALNVSESIEEETEMEEEEEEVAATEGPDNASEESMEEKTAEAESSSETTTVIDEKSEKISATDTPADAAAAGATTEEEPVETNEETATESAVVDEKSEQHGEADTPNNATTTGSSGDDDLPDCWVETQDTSTGKVYYYNTLTQLTSWEKPAKTVDAASPTDGEIPSDNAPEADNSDQVQEESPADDVNDGWTEVTDPNTGDVYYYNERTQETSWEKPSTTSSSAELEGGWSEVVDPDSGKTYYFNASTNETSWTKPEVDRKTTKEVTEPAPQTDPTSREDFSNTATSESVNVGTSSNAAQESPVQASSPKAFPLADRTVSAEDLFSTEPAINAESSSAVNPVSDSTAEPEVAKEPTASSPVVNEASSAADLFSSPSDPPTDKPPVDSMNKEATATNDIPDHEGEEDVMEEVPLSPDVAPKIVASNPLPTTTTTATSANTGPADATEDLPSLGPQATSAQPSNDLFAAIGMPPPPVRTRR